VQTRIKGQKPKGTGPRAGSAETGILSRVPGATDEKILRWLHSARIPGEDRERILKFASSGLPVFLLGEEGTGKGEVAKALHFLGVWKNHPFLHLSCRGLTSPKFVEKLSLWGKDRGPGEKVSLALYLEDAENLDEDLQTLLLDLLTDQKVHWPGLEELSFHLQVISSSSSSLAEAVTEKKFREDLFRTLEMLSIHLPPLRDRKEDIPRLAREILQERYPGGKDGKDFSAEALEALQKYDWPGNLPELESVVLRSAALRDGNLLDSEDLVFSPSSGPMGPKTPPGGEKESWFDVTIPTLAHEIKNPLVAIGTFAHLLPEKYDDPEFRGEFSRLVNQDIRRINEILENLMEFAQLSEPRYSHHDLNSILTQALEQQEKESGLPAKEVRTDLGTGLPLILFDKSHLGFVLRNLLENALSRMTPPGSLHFSTRFFREEGRAGPKDSVDLILWYNSPGGVLPNFSKVVGFEAEMDFQNLNMALLLIRKVMVRNRGKMQILQDEDGGMTIRLQFPPGGRREGSSKENHA
jgi:DNA-binding NtrC family response regulator